MLTVSVFMDLRRVSCLDDTRTQTLLHRLALCLSAGLNGAISAKHLFFFSLSCCHYLSRVLLPFTQSRFPIGIKLFPLEPSYLGVRLRIRMDICPRGLRAHPHRSTLSLMEIFVPEELDLTALIYSTSSPLMLVQAALVYGEAHSSTLHPSSFLLL